MRTILLLLGIAVAGVFPVLAEKPPSDERIEQVRREFLALRRPIPYDSILSDPGEGALNSIVLKGHSKEFVEKFRKEELVYALWKYLDDQRLDAEATIVLMGAVGGGAMGASLLTYQDAEHPGNWLEPEFREYWVACCKNDSVFAIGKGYDDGWYPHKVLFDKDTIRRDRTNEVLRAQHIEAMRAALRDPSLGRENPLEVKNIFHLLSVLKAREAVPEGVAYFFYSWKQGGDYRLRPQDFELRPNFGVSTIQDAISFNLGQQCPAPFFLASNVGTSSVPMVLERLSKTTPKERAMEDGGGCAPAFALHYFWCLDYTRSQTIKAIEDFKQANSNLTAEQIVTLNSLLDDIRAGKYQGDRRCFKPEVWGK